MLGFAIQYDVFKSTLSKILKHEIINTADVARRVKVVTRKVSINKRDEEVINSVDKWK